MIGEAYINIRGTVVAEPELIETKNGKSLLKLRVAVNEKVGDEIKASFFNVVSWRETLNNKLMQIEMVGKNVAIRGNVSMDTWEKDGHKFKDYPINMDRLGFLDKKSEEAN